MNWSLGYKASYRAYMVDPVTWADRDAVDILSGNINRTSSGLRESADISCIDYSHGSDKWIRIWMDAEQDGAHEHIAIFTGLTSAPERKINGTISEIDLQCFSTLKPAQDVYLPRGWYATKGFIGAEVIHDLLSIGPAPVTYDEGSPRLSQHIIAEDGETNLSMAYKVLDAIGWRIRIEGTGEIHIGPAAEEPSAVYSAVDNDQIEPSVNVKNDWFECPNVFRAVSGSGTATAVDENPDSPLSTISRGREIWKEETSVKLNDGESLLAYARRRLRELQTTATEISYSRSYDPNVRVTDRIRLSYPAQDLSGVFVVESQKISLDHSGTTAEEVRTA